MKKKITIEIPDIPLSLNRYLTMHWAVRGKYKEEWRLMIYHLWLSEKKITLSSPVKVHIAYYFADNRLRDYDNYSGKVIMDGLKDTFITDDNARDCVKELTLSMYFKQKQKKTSITISEL